MVHGRVDGSEAGCEDMDASEVAAGKVGKGGDVVRPAEPMVTRCLTSKVMQFDS